MTRRDRAQALRIQLSNARCFADGYGGDYEAFHYGNKRWVYSPHDAASLILDGYPVRRPRRAPPGQAKP